MSSTKRPPSKTVVAKAASAYETPTDEKRFYGARFRAAREAAGMTLTDAAHRLGYSQPVQLSLLETGIRAPSFKLVTQCRPLYGTTADFLIGATPDPDPDPVLAAQRHIASSVSASLQLLAGNIIDTNARIVRELMPESAQGLRLASLVLELSEAIASFRTQNPRFEDMRGGAKVLMRMELASSAAQQYAERADRSRRLMHSRAMQGLPVTLATPQLSLFPALEAAD